MDEMTGIQALERKATDLPMRPGKIQRQEFEYIRHGTQTLIASFDVVSGQVIQSTVGDTRTERLYHSCATNHRKLLRRASFTSIADLKTRILEFIDYFNRTMAKPFKWTYKGKALAA
jgi:hypothetical protein